MRRGSMFAIMKEVLPTDLWVAEPKLLALMHSRGVTEAAREDFTAFYNVNRWLLDRMMSGGAGGEKGYESILVNKFQHFNTPKVRHYYKLSAPNAKLRYASPGEQPDSVERPLRRQRALDKDFIINYNADFRPPPPPPPREEAARLKDIVTDTRRPTLEPAKQQRRVRTPSPRPSSTPAGSYSNFGDQQVSVLFACAFL